MNDDKYLPASVWTFPDVILLFFGGLLGSLVFITVGAIFNGGEIEGVPLLLVSSVAQALTIIGILHYMSRTRGTASWDLDFGFRFEARDAFGLLYGAGLQLAVAFFVTLPLIWLLGLEDPPEQDVTAIAGEASSLIARIAIVLMVVVIAPLTEELVYRGVLLARLRRGLSARVSVAVAALVWSGIHLVDPDAAPFIPGLFVIGLVLGYQALRTNRIGLSIMTHAGVNLLAAIAILAGFDIG